MEIKIINTNSKQNQTHLFEGSEIYHEHVLYDSVDKFIEEYNKYGGKDFDGSVIGVPDYYWKKDPPNEGGYFLYIQYRPTGESSLKFIVVKNATVYFTAGGQTIDKIIVA